MASLIYNTARWRSLSARAIVRDDHKCTVARLLGGACSDDLHAHHIVPVRDGGAPFDLDNVGTACSIHHPMWEALRRILARKLTAPPPRCGHQHRSAEARAICERRMARQQGRVAA